jgi:hypothetical protein
MEAIADEPGAPLEVVVERAELAAGEAVVDVLEAEEFVHPASPRANAARAISDQLRKRDMNKLSFPTPSQIRREW